MMMTQNLFQWMEDFQGQLNLIKNGQVEYSVGKFRYDLFIY